jgi:CxxC-x17-CxxC domain-containing protein
MNQNNTKGSSGSFRRQGNSRNFNSQRSRPQGRNNGNFRNSGNFRRNNFSSGPREMHKATCSECKKQCEVPFKPTEGKPVYCKECFAKRKSY